jgi:hypothetical protein
MLRGEGKGEETVAEEEVDGGVVDEFGRREELGEGS